MSNKKALLVGINYPGTSSELRGCVNDVIDMQEMLGGIYGFSDMKTLLDEQATTQNILDELENLVRGATAGDVLFFHYSGHGSQMMDNSDADHEPDGLDEIICPIDLDWKRKVIRDDDLKRIFDKVPADVNLTVVLDCCNSGGGMDQIEQYQPETKRVFEIARGESRYMAPPNNAIKRHLGVKPRTVQSRQVDQTGLLISGCRSDQTSADAYINGRYNGACTYMLIKTLREADWSCDYKTLIDTLNNLMEVHGFTQRPELNGSSALYSKTFLEAFEVPEEVEEVEEVEEEEVLQTLAQQPGGWAITAHANMIESNNYVEVEPQVEEPELNFFQKLIQAVTSLFSKLF
jgi:hypothetical protein